MSDTVRNFIPTQTISQAGLESTALRVIAALLGKDEQWDDPSGLLEEIADTISGAGLPHPGLSTNTERYLDYSNALWDAENPE